MEEKIHQLISERNPWLLKDTLLSKSVYKVLKKYLKFDETVFVGEHIQSMSSMSPQFIELAIALSLHS